MADYALVKDEDGEVHGLWLREAGKADNKALVSALLAKHSIAMPDEVRVVTNTYNDKRNLLTTTDALGNTTSYAYTYFGAPETITDPLGNVTTFEYQITH